MNWKLLLAMVLTATLTGALWWSEHTAAQRLQTELAAAKAQLSELEKLRAELERLAAENQRLRAEAVDPSELARLRALGNDVRRLQGENAELEKKHVAAEAARAQMARESTGSASTNETPKFKLLSKGRAAVSAGQTIIAGGWLTSDGKRAVAFITPTVDADNAVNPMVSINVQLLGIPQELFGRSSLDWFLQEESVGLGALNGVLDSPVLQKLREFLAREGQPESLYNGPGISLPFGLDPDVKPGIFSGKYLLEFGSLQRGRDGRGIVLDFSLSETMVATTP